MAQLTGAPGSRPPPDPSRAARTRPHFAPLSPAGPLFLNVASAGQRPIGCCRTSGPLTSWLLVRERERHVADGLVQAQRLRLGEVDLAARQPASRPGGDLG